MDVMIDLCVPLRTLFKKIFSLRGTDALATEEKVVSAAMERRPIAILLFLGSKMKITVHVIISNTWNTIRLYKLRTTYYLVLSKVGSEYINAMHDDVIRTDLEYSFR